MMPGTVLLIIGKLADQLQCAIEANDYNCKFSIDVEGYLHVKMIRVEAERMEK
jgi:hypothetical protein